MVRAKYVWFLVLVFLLSVVPLNAQQEITGTIRCGDIAEGEIVAGQADMFGSRGDRSANNFAMNIPAGTRINLTVEPLGGTFNVGFVLVDSGGNDTVIVNNSIEGMAERLDNFALGSSNQILRIVGVKPGNITQQSDTFAGTQQRLFANFDSAYGNAGFYFGAYQISVGCTLRDGTVIEPGDNLEESAAPGASGAPRVVAPAFSGFGFPGVGAVDFSSGIEIPIVPGQAQTVPVGGDLVALYTYDTSLGNPATLRLSRVSGNISIGVAVTRRDTNEIIFVGGLPLSNNLSVELAFPSEGIYVIGLFRLDTPTLSGSSGAVQISVE